MGADAAPQSTPPAARDPSKSKRSTLRSILSRLSSKRQQRANAGQQRTPRPPSRPLAESSEDASLVANGEDSNRGAAGVAENGKALQDGEISSPSRRGSSMTGPSRSFMTGPSSLDDHSDPETGADTNASVRPITPSSFVDSGSTSNLSHTANTFRSNQTGQSHASTKPTTLLSLGSESGANRIAQPSSISQRPHSFVGSSSVGGVSDQQAAPNRLPSFISRRDSSNTTGSASQPLAPSSASITFSALPPPSPQISTAPNSPHGLNHDVSAAGAALSADGSGGIFRVPRYSQPHAKNNPHPASIPPDNSSTLTLASSMAAPSLRNHGARHDEDASVRALPPSRRDSEASLASKWSAAILSGKQRPDSVVTAGTTGSAPLKTATSTAATEDAPLNGDSDGEPVRQKTPPVPAANGF